MFDQNLILENNFVALKVMTAEDKKALRLISNSSSIWNYFTSNLKTARELDYWVDDAIRLFNLMQRIPFTITSKLHKRPIGSTSFGNISVPDKRIEIGWTWLGRNYQGRGYNKQCKFLLLQYAFEVLQFKRVEFKTDVLNLQSRKALKKIGAVEEGILRSHTVMPKDRRRDTIYYSILREEWDNVKIKYFSDVASENQSIRFYQINHG